MKNASVLVLMELYDHRIRQGNGCYAANKHNNKVVHIGSKGIARPITETTLKLDLKKGRTDGKL